MTSLKSYAIPANLTKEIDDLEILISKFGNGEISETELKSHRVPFGIYEQRQKGTYMIRIRCTAGIITPLQLKAVANVSKRLSSGSLHVTTRQEIQIHDVVIHNIIPILRELKEYGLSSRGGGGNTVRNITTSVDSGISINELFDVTPYAIALTNKLIALNSSWLLPRKYKIAFSNTEKDSAYASINDLGFIPVIKDGIKGFKVYVAGGMGRKPQPGNVLHDFVDGKEIYVVAESIKRLFSQFGNRKNKHAARLRFLWATLGKDEFVRLYNVERERVLSENNREIAISEIANLPYEKIVEDKKEIFQSEDFTIWKKRFVKPQKQDNGYSIIIPLALGMITADQAIILSELTNEIGENSIRFSQDQNITLRNVTDFHLEKIFTIVTENFTLSKTPLIQVTAIACAGASTCQLGICRSRDLLNALNVKIADSSIDLDAISNVRIHISGCTNSCGQHLIAEIGLYGKVGRKGQHSYPMYGITGGAYVNEGGHWVFGEKIDEASAKDIPEIIKRILLIYASEKNNYRNFKDFLQSKGKQEIVKLCDVYREIPDINQNDSYYKDWGEDSIFSLAGKGTGECSAGLFDLIEIDMVKIKSIRNSLETELDEKKIESYLYDLALISARSLLITRGLEASTDKEVFDLFITHFVNQNLVDLHFADLLSKVTVKSGDLNKNFKKQIIEFSFVIEQLYQNMDNSLQFKSVLNVKNSSNLQSAETDVKVDLVKELVGVKCPMNFVKTKMALSQLEKGNILEITLDDGEPIDNVPKSVKEEGHVILSEVKVDNYWRVRIKKGPSNA